MGIGRTQTASSPLCTSCTALRLLCTSCTLCPPPWQNKPPPPWHFVFSEDLTAPPAAVQRCTNMFNGLINWCSKMYTDVKNVQRYTSMYKDVHKSQLIYKDPSQVPPSHCKVVGKPQQELFLKLPCSCSVLLSRNNLAPLDKS